MNGLGQDSEVYYSEEFNAINDIFLELIDTGYYYNDWVPPLIPDKYLIDYAKHPHKYRNELKQIDKVYPSFNYSKRLIDTKGDTGKLREFKDRFEKYADSIKNLYDTRRLLLFVRDSLYSTSNYEKEDLRKVARRDSTLFEISYKHKYKTREFNFFNIQNTGKYELTNEEYPDQKVRISTKDIKEIGQLTFSRVVFDSEFKNGFFFYRFYKASLNAFELLIFIEKINGKWIIKEKIGLWVS